MATAGVGESKELKIVDIHEAETNLSQLVEEAAAGESFPTAKEGKPMVTVVGLDTPEEEKPTRRLGFLKGKVIVPVDIKTMFKDEIEEMFYGKE